jgi:CO/xanthine dehydrogenase FAD-binding subunit
MLMALKVEIVLYKNGRMPLEEYLRTKISKDIMLKLVIKEDKRKASFKFMRNSYYDFSILNVSVSASEDLKDFRVAVGARPGVAVLAKEAMNILNSGQISEELINDAATTASEEISFASDIRGSKEYRKEVCKTLIKRGLLEVSGL